MTFLIDIEKQIRVRDILTYFGIEVNSSNKCLCPFHEDKNPSMIVNETNVYCFSCHKAWDVVQFVQKILNLASNKEAIMWIQENISISTNLSQKRELKKSVYKGPVPFSFVRYWASCLTQQHVEQLQRERLLTPETIFSYGLGWRPDCQAYVIPFFAGEPLKSAVNIVQFRLTNPTQNKYVGLKGHNRTEIMNLHLLETEQPFVILFFGSFDAILGFQDNLPAVGLNGSYISKSDQDRILSYFKKQSKVYIVPDNNKNEINSANQIAEMLSKVVPDVKVRCFPESYSVDTDYIDYRKSGATVSDFLYDVLCIYPQIKPYILEILLTYIYTSQFIKNDVQSYLKGFSVRDVVYNLKQYIPSKHPELNPLVVQLSNISDYESFIKTLSFYTTYTVGGGW